MAKNTNVQIPTISHGVVSPMYNTWDATGKNFGYAMSEMNKGLQAVNPVVSHSPETSYGYRMSFRNIQPNTSVRTGFNRGDYNYFRPDEAVPTRFKDILYLCQTVYQNVPIVKQIIDLMSDFSTKGIRLVHQNAEIQKYYEAWWDKVDGKYISERIVNILLRLGVSYIRRYTVKLTARQEDKIYRTQAVPDYDYIEPILNGRGEVPLKYMLYDPLTIENLGGSLQRFAGESVYSLALPQDLKNMILHPKPEEVEIVKKLPQDIVDAVVKGYKLILPNDRLTVLHYKKDEWAEWAHPMIYPILKDVIILEKLKLADQTALDGVISKVRVWKLGSMEHKIVPGPDAISKFSEFLLNNVGGGTVDIVWGPAVELLETNVGVQGVLGEEKYKPILTSIYSGLGVPPTLTGMDSKGGFTNNSISMKTMIERLQYVRDLLVKHWTNEVELVRRAKGFRYPAALQFDDTILTDENQHHNLLMALNDRGIISDERMREIANQNPDVEKKRLQREWKERGRGSMPPKGDPFHSGNLDADLRKIALQTGQATLGELGVELDEREEGEEPMLDKNIKLEKMKAKSAKPPFGGGKVGSKKPKGQPNKGRPVGKKDGSKRTRNPKPIRGKGNVTIWANQAQRLISKIVTPLVLQLREKNSARQFTQSEFEEVESLKFALLSSFGPFEEITEELVLANLQNELPIELLETFEEYAEVFRLDLGREPSTDEMRELQSVAYKKWITSDE